MSYLVNWVTQVVSISTSDLVLVLGNHYRLPMIEFLIEIRRLESEFTGGLWASQILDHTNPKLDFAGASYAGFDEIINNYTIEFTGLVDRVDLVGSNNNIVDILIPTGVSIVPSNSGGLIYNENQSLSNSDMENIARYVWNALTANHTLVGSFGRYMTKSLLTIKKFIGLSK